MFIFNCILWILVGALAGTVAGRVLRGRGYGLARDVFLGLMGSLVGNVAFSVLGMHTPGILWQIVVSTVGAVLFIVLVRVFVDSDFAK